MSFVKRLLTENEWSLANVALAGIEDRRRPSRTKEWVLDAERQIFCTQLISDTWEMREGQYWYLLLVRDGSCIYSVDAFSQKKGQPTKASLDSMGSTKRDIVSLRKLAVEANAVLCPGERLAFC